MNQYWILDEYGEIVPVDLLTWAAWFEVSADRRRLRRTDVGDQRVSTVFIGMDLAPWRGPDGPYLFETIVFSPDGNYTIGRYATMAEALFAHEKTVRSLRDA